ncbi:acyl-CoA dehydrogenase [Candidatus Desantisbacteria bacterium CG2_30_40_21]|uniref:Acyl-CoA dehydrogenase n=5 Tax=unclassified Candidatus Desantisiibacteriota TaxID=3106372 RepID=A0A2M7JDE3_9BACT|nr:MAG: acyl-CoA dehydrogenase [Candidatus Desantisbacteria bacterium CG2_30_40_21]PIP39939.1 MAG: acyl-CoA dehydrogenase [Candidatus Desantisbacteria bacterium CG23_combo_of_CG06-09_8_20_14_all_40_23]PIX17417.1 MAG: acyl-CoA dehydrogenase [Candidatus Desantisbacteria bacterium CG_4_8_14_3_um_filter_40_12]PIY20476.1 MAG: acyl-CoA dehydrogenase [Candidatus Desantisbacteria bacterium CG_4_10_14_3_um_filter_40_18]PJB29119.1 MAG: acyl-CoA dehydrogenase [Candidatus Desantisbacteria bacterium CG_4_9_
MNYFLTEEQQMIKDLAAKIATEKAAPLVAELDEKEEFPWEVMKTLASSDLFGVYLPEEYGGFGGGVFELCLVTEELSKVCCGMGVCYAASALGTLPILLFGSDAQKQKYLPDIAAGKKLAAFGLTEANAGSDAAAVATTATRESDFYVLNGTKQWITNAGEAEVYTVIALTDKTKGVRGASAFIVEKGTPGFSFGKKEKKMGIRCSATRELIFQDCRIPKENIISREGMGFIVAMKTLDRARPGVASQGVGLAQGALDHAVKYSRERVQFGQAISSFQAIQHMLADMATQTEAARALTYAAARMIDAGKDDISKEAAMSKLFATDICMKVTTDAVQIFGGYGYMREYPVEKMMRDAKILQIYEGTNQIQRNVIGLTLIKEMAKKK